MNTATNEPTTSNAVPPNSTAENLGRRTLISLIAGLAVASFLGWFLLSAALSLMFMIGLFFFMLFGLIIAATMFRVLAPVRPVRRSRIIVITAIVALVCWSLALAKECLDFPEDFVETTMKKRRVYIPPGEGGYARVRTEVRQFIETHLEEKYPPGGALGYIRLTISGDPIEVDIPSQPASFTIAPRTKPWVWWTRGVLALVLLYATMHTVLIDLTRPAKPGASPGTAAES